jgi:hypothetical protein
MKKLYLLFLAIISAITYAHATDYYIVGGSYGWDTNNYGNSKYKLQQQDDGIYFFDEENWGGQAFKFLKSNSWKDAIGNGSDNQVLTISPNDDLPAQVYSRNGAENNIALDSSCTGKKVRIYLYEYNSKLYITVRIYKDIADGYYLIGDNYGGFNSCDEAYQLTKAEDDSNIYFIENVLKGRFKIQQFKEGFPLLKSYGNPNAESDYKPEVEYHTSTTVQASPSINTLYFDSNNSKTTYLIFNAKENTIFLMGKEMLYVNIYQNYSGDPVPMTPHYNKTYTSSTIPTLEGEFLVAGNKDYSTFKFGSTTKEDISNAANYCISVQNQNCDNIRCSTALSNVVLTLDLDKYTITAITAKADQSYTDNSTTDFPTGSEVKIIVGDNTESMTYNKDDNTYTYTYSGWQQNNTLSFSIGDTSYGPQRTSDASADNTVINPYFGGEYYIGANSDHFILGEHAAGKDIKFTLSRQADGSMTVSATYANESITNGYYLVGYDLGSWKLSEFNRFTSYGEDGKYLYINIPNMSEKEFKVAYVENGEVVNYYGNDAKNVPINQWTTLTANQANLKIQAPSLAGIRGNLRFYLDTSNGQVKLLPMRNYIAVRGSFNGNTRDANILHNYRLEPNPNITYSISLSALNGRFKLCAVDGSDNTFEYGAESSSDNTIGLDEYKKAISGGAFFNTKASYKTVTMTLVADASNTNYSNIILQATETLATDKYIFGNLDGSKSNWWGDDPNGDADRIYLTETATEGIYTCQFNVPQDKTGYFLLKLGNTVCSAESDNYGISDNTPVTYYTDRKHCWAIASGTWFATINTNDNTITFKKATQICLNMKINNETSFVSDDFEYIGSTTDKNNETRYVYTLYFDNSYQLYGTIQVYIDKDHVNQWGEKKKTGSNKGFRTVRPNNTYTEMEIFSQNNNASLFLAPGSYVITVELDGSNNIKSLLAEGTQKYPTCVWIFGDIDIANNTFQDDDKIRGGCPFEGHGIKATDVQIADTLNDDISESDYLNQVKGLESLCGYYIARKVKFTNHKYPWNKYDNVYCNESDEFDKYDTNNFAATHCIFGLTESMVTPESDKDYDNNNLKWDNTTYQRLGTRLGSDYSALVDFASVSSDDVLYNSYELIPTKVTTSTVFEWDYDKNQVKGFNYLPMSVTSVEALCYAVPYTATNSSDKPARYSQDVSQIYGDNEYDVLIDLVNQRICLANGAIATSVPAIEEAFGDNLVNVYNMQGIMVRHDVKANDAAKDLPTGIYIVGNKKVFVRN